MNLSRGHIYIVDMEPRINTKPGKVRPAVVIQSDLVNQTGYASTVLIPLTTQIGREEGIFRVRIPKGICGLEKESDILVTQIIAVSNASFKKDLGVLPSYILEELNEKIKTLLDV